MPTKWPAINIWLRDICPRHGRCGPVLPIAVSLHALQRACLAWVLYLWSASVTTWLYAASTSTFPRSKFCWIRSTDPTFVGSWRVLGATMSGRLYYPDSLGDLYGRVTELLGFRANLEEHKVQWLSAAGDDRFRDLFLDIVPMRDSEWPRLDRSFFDAERLTHGGFSARFYERLGIEEGAMVPEPLRAPLAAGIQRAVEHTVVRMAGSGTRHLCFAGGLGLNALLVSALERSSFENVFVQPAAGDAGTAIGAVLHTWHAVYNQPQRIGLDNLYLGPSYTAEEIKRVLENCKLRFRYILTTEETIETAIAQLAENRIVAWMHGRMEFGPRAL